MVGENLFKKLFEPDLKKFSNNQKTKKLEIHVSG
jgi:hypothetical protein